MIDKYVRIEDPKRVGNFVIRLTPELFAPINKLEGLLQQIVEIGMMAGDSETVRMASEAKRNLSFAMQKIPFDYKDFLHEVSVEFELHDYLVIPELPFSETCGD